MGPPESSRELFGAVDTGTVAIMAYPAISRDETVYSDGDFSPHEEGSVVNGS